MLKIVFLLTLLVGLAVSANLHRHNTDVLDQYLSFPYSSITCGELRKQFENGYIHLKDFLDRIRNCKESKEFSNHRRHHHRHNHDMTDSDFYDPSNVNKKSDYTYTDYLLPVMRDVTPTTQPTVNLNGDSTKPTTIDGHFVSPLMQNQAFDSQGNPNTQTYVPRKQKTVNGIVVDSIAGQLILKSLQNNVMGNQRFSVPTYDSPFQQPTLASFSPATTTGNHPESWSEYFQFRNLLNNMGYDKRTFTSPIQTDRVNKIDQALARSQLAHPDSDLTNHQAESPFYNMNSRNMQTPSSIENNVLLNPLSGPTLQNLASFTSIPEPGLSNTEITPMDIMSSYTKDLPLITNKAVSTLTNPTNTVGLQRGNILIPGITTAADLESPNTMGVTDLTSKVSLNDLKKVDDDLEDDVSLLGDNNSRQRHLSLTNYESFTPQIIEKIAERSKINRANNIDTKNETVAKRILASDSTPDGSNSVKDILDIKYAQLERKLLGDLRRRQSILQRLEQESMIHHFSLPGTIPLSKLGDVFQKINAETAKKTSKGIRKSIENSILSKQQALELQDELGLFETNQKPTEKRSLTDFSGVQVNSLSNQGVDYIAHHLPQNFMLSYYKNRALNINPQKTRLKSDQIPDIDGPINRTNRPHSNTTNHLLDISNTTNHLLDISLKGNESNGNASISSNDNIKRAMQILKNKQNIAEATTASKGNVGEKRANIASKPKPDKPEIFSRNILFTNKLFNEVIRAAMRRKNTIEKIASNNTKDINDKTSSNYEQQKNHENGKLNPDTKIKKKEDSGNHALQKKDVILRIREKLRKRRFKISDVNRGISNAKNRLNHVQ